MIAQNTSATSAKEWPAESNSSSFERSTRPASPGAITEPTEFFELSQRCGITLRGVAGANLGNTDQILFFESEGNLDKSQAIAIPMRRIDSLVLKSEAPVDNTPLDFPSLWEVEIRLHPTQKARKQEIFTVFEQD